MLLDNFLWVETRTILIICNDLSIHRELVKGEVVVACLKDFLSPDVIDNKHVTLEQRHDRSVAISSAPQATQNC